MIVLQGLEMESLNLFLYSEKFREILGEIS